MRHRSISARMLMAIVLAGLLLAGIPAGASADGESVLTLTAPREAVLGEPMPLRVTLHDDTGAPIAEAVVRILLPTEFLNKFSRVEVGRVLTGPDGRGLLIYEPRQSGVIGLQAEWTPEEGDALTVALESEVFGDRQLVIEEFGNTAPQFEPWLIVVVLTIVWLTLFSVALRIYAIHLQSAAPGEVPEYFRSREEWS